MLRLESGSSRNGLCRYRLSCQRTSFFTRPSVEIDTMFGIGQTELIILALVLVLLFGSTKLPSLMRNLGRSATEFKKAMRDDPPDDSGEKLEKRKEDTINT